MEDLTHMSTPWESEPNFDIGLNSDDIDELYNDMNVSFESDMDMEIDDQSGGGERFTIELLKERKIVKFNVQGYEYRVRVDSLDRNLSFAHVVRTLHSIMEG